MPAAELPPTASPIATPPTTADLGESMATTAPPAATTEATASADEHGKNQAQPELAAPASTTSSTVTSEPLPLKEPDTSEDPPAPTAQDGVQPPDGAGLIIGIPIISGFITQPPAEQYVQEGTDAKLDAKFTEAELHLSGSERVYLTKWTWNGTSWLKKDDPNPYSATGSLNNKFSVTINFGKGQREELPMGHYYFQLHFTSGNVLHEVRYSKLAKIVVESDESAATSLNVSTDAAVVFPNVEYQVAADILPSHSTSVVGWQSQGVTLDRNYGRWANFHLEMDQLKNWVNTDLTRPGLPVTMSARANNLQGSTTVHAGGLVARSLPLDQAREQGIAWPVAGLEQLQRDLYDPNTARATVTQTKYKWTYFQKNNRGRYVERDFPKTVQHASGTLQQPTDLNGSQALQINGDDAFINTLRTATANQAPIYAKLALTLTVKAGRGTKTISLPTNQAQLRITEPVGQLALQAVPTFDFAMIASRLVYQGNQQTNSADKIVAQPTANHVQVRDTRPGNHDWQLQVAMSPLTDEAGQNLAASRLQLSGAVLPQSIDVVAGQAPVVIATAAQGQSRDLPMQAELKLAANPQIKLNQQTKFSAQLLWTLTTTQPAPAPLP